MEGGGAVGGYAAHVLVLRVEGEERKEQGKSGCCCCCCCGVGRVCNWNGNSLSTFSDV